jgi:hypothetical protein
MNNWQPIDQFPPGLIDTPVLFYSKKWISQHEPDGIVQGFQEHKGSFVGGFWNNYHDTWDCNDCVPTHFMLLSPPEETNED